MAKIRDTAATINTTATASMVCEMPTHETGDLLVAFVNKDSTSLFTTPSGWAAIRTGASAGAGGGVYTKRATSSSETVTFALTIETCTAVVISVYGNEAEKDSGTVQIDVVAGTGTYTRASGSFSGDGFVVGQTVNFSGFTNAGNNGAKQLVTVGTTTCTTATTGMVNETGSGDERAISTGIGVSAFSGADDSTNPVAGVGATTSFSNSFLLHGLSGDAVTAPIVLPPWVSIFAGDAGANAIACSYSFEPTASTAVTAPNHWLQGQDDARGFFVEVIDGSSGGILPAYISLDTTPCVQISPLTGSGTTTVENGAYVAAASIAITSVAGKTVAGVTVATTADTGINVFRSTTRNAGASSTTNLNHTEFDLTTPYDVAADLGLVFGTFWHASPRDFFDSGKAAQGGKYILMGSSTTAWRAWVVGGQGTVTDKADARNNFLIEVADATTQYASNGSPNWASLDYMAFGSAGYYGAPAISWNMLFSIKEFIIGGGGSTEPMTFDELVYTINNGAGEIPLVQQSGAGGMFWCPVRFGGTDPIKTGFNLNSFQYPRRADEVNYTDFHLTPNKIGFEFYGTGSGDTLSITNCVFTSPSSYYWRFNSSHSASTVMDFSGTSVVNAVVTLRSTVTLDSMIFIDCGTFTQNASTITNSAFSNTMVTSASPTDMDNISDSSFTSGGTGYAIAVGSAIAVPGSPLSITFSGNTFSGYAGSDGTTGNEAIHVLYTSGTLTINIAGGGSTPSIRTDGATVVVQNVVTVKVTAKDATTLAALEDVRVLLEADSVATGTHTGSDNASTLTDGSQSFTIDALIGYRIYNTTDGSDGLITDNDATTVTATLAGGTQNDWDTSDAYIIVAKPALNPVSITWSSPTATVTHKNHGLSSGASVVIRGTTQDEYIGTYTISNVSTNAYDYTVTGTPATPATGSPTSTAVILNGVTGDGDPDPAGVLQTTTFNYTLNQPTIGKARRATTGTNYKTGTITGTITNAGLDTTVLLIVDE